MATVRLEQSGQLVWAPSSSSARRFDLRAGEQAVASLTFDKDVGSLATGRGPGGVWTLKRAGFLQPRVTVREAGSEYDVAVFRPTWTGSGDVEFRTGTRVHWRPFGFWNSEWAFVQGTERLVTFHWLPDTAALDARVEFTVAAMAMPEFPVLMLLGWYLRVLAFLEAQHANGA